MNHPHHPVRIAIVGAGSVGSTLAYTLSLSGLAAEIVLLDVNKTKAEGEALDLTHSNSLTRTTRVWAGDDEDCESASVIVFTAGVPAQRGERYLDFLKRNIALLRDVIPRIARYNQDGILLIASPPVDILTYAAYKISGWSEHRVIGSGTVSDTARFRELLGNHYQLAPQNVHAYIIGEQGEREVPVWSLANITGMQLKDFCFTNGIHYDQKTLDDLFKKTRDAVAHITDCKGTTDYATANGLAQLVEAILKNQKSILCVSSLIANYYGINGVCLSLPAIIGRAGVEKLLRLDLNQQEVEALKHSAEMLSTNLALLALEAR